MKLAVFHYHLLPGGVTSVISLSLQAVSSHLTELEEIVLVCGREENVVNIQKTVQSTCKDLQCRISAVVMPEIGYADEQSVKEIDFSELKSTLISRFEGFIWWVHNYHIGKNPLFTRCIIEIAEEYPAQQFVLHIHDFPECARYANLHFIRQYYTESLYPVSNNVWYTVINTRDYELLRAAGLPETRTVLLQNPVSKNTNIPELSDSARCDIRSILQTFDSYNPDAPSLLYPVRSIRRKNVLEAGLLTVLIDPPVNLLLTLPGTSDQEAPYSDMVQHCYQTGLIRGAFPTGKVIDFHDIIAFSDGILSSSAQEGFGYLFIDTIQWEKPLVARYLEILRDFTPYFHTDYHYVYKQLLVPADVIDLQQLEEEYRRFIGSFAQYLLVEQKNSLQSELEKLCKQDVIDFSFLSPAMQIEILQKCTRPGLDTELAHLNGALIERISHFIHTNQYYHSVDVEGSFGFSRYAETCGQMFTAMERSSKEDTAAGEGASASRTEFHIDKYILDYFARLEYFRLLYVPLV